jgi:hypothetical protein
MAPMYSYALRNCDTALTFNYVCDLDEHWE